MPNILVVEDEPDSREVLVRALTRAGHRVRALANGQEALADLLREDADVIVLDVRMPIMDGVTFMQVIRSYLRFQEVPVVVVTAITDGHELQRVMAHGVARAFAKAHFDLPDFVACVELLADGFDALPSQERPNPGVRPFTPPPQ